MSDSFSRDHVHGKNAVAQPLTMFRSLEALLGHGGQAHTWLTTRNVALGIAPVELLESTEGLVRVVHYLDAYQLRTHLNIYGD